MADLGAIKWDGQSGKEYEYHIYTLDETHKAIPANYVFVKQTEPKRYRPLYVGETNNISERFENHEKWPDLKKNGVTHVCTHESSSDKKVRTNEESDIIAKWKPVCND